MSAPYSSSGEPSMWNGPSTVAGVAPLSRRWFIWTTSIDRPSTSEARMNSSRFSSLICPVRVSHWIAAIHSGSVRRTSRAKSCRWRTSACMICASRGSCAVPQRAAASSVMLSSVTSCISTPCSTARPYDSSARSSAAAPAMARILPSADARGRYFIPQSGAITSRCAGR